MTKFLFGRSPLTTIIGYVVAALTAIHQSSTTGAQHWQDYLLPAFLALFGRFAADDQRFHTPKLPEAAPTSPANSEAQAPNTVDWVHSVLNVMESIIGRHNPNNLPGCEPTDPEELCDDCRAKYQAFIDAVENLLAPPDVAPTTGEATAQTETSASPAADTKTAQHFVRRGRDGRFSKLAA